jgi:hypothetical protein
MHKCLEFSREKCKKYLLKIQKKLK